MVQTTPLKGRVVAITRPTGQAEEAGQLIVAKGGVPYYIPAIDIKGLSNPEPMKKFIAELSVGQVDYIILMSTNGVISESYASVAYDAGVGFKRHTTLKP